MKELLYGLMLRSGNDAAVALAIATAGSVDAFVKRMNEKAQALGMEHTHFENPNGLDGENHYSTARDLSKLCVHAMENETARSFPAKALRSTAGALRITTSFSGASREPTV